jgi:hypothetical protein
MREYRGFWREYWWVCVGSFALPGVVMWLNWVPLRVPEKEALVLDTYTFCQGIERPAPGYCELHTR